MSETLNSGEATAPAATKVPVEISNEAAQAHR